MSTSTVAGHRPASPAQLDWLTGEVAAWRTEGLVSPEQATAILGRYTPSRRTSLARLLLALGATFVGVGLIWLVAANLDELPPLGRFTLVATVWLPLLAGAEVLARRRAHSGTIPSPVVGAVRILAALAFGAVVFQAAQSLQVPAFEPVLLGAWSAGALVHAYAVRGLGPLVVGVATGVGWVIWQTVWESPSAFAGVLTVLAAAVVMVGVAAAHERRLPGFGAVWREAGAALSLGGLFFAALPFVTAEDTRFTGMLVAVLVAAALAAVAGVVLSTGAVRLEPAAAVAVAVVGVLLVLWDAGRDAASVGPEDWAHAGASVVAYVAAAIWVAALGILRDSWRLTALALVAVVAFTTFQSFAVFAQIIQGAWLFVVLGLVLLGTGLGFDRARRRIASTLEEAER